MTGLLFGATLMGGAHMGGMPQFNSPQLSQMFGGGILQNPAIIMQGLPGQGGPQLPLPQMGLPGQGMPSQGLPFIQGYPSAQGGNHPLPQQFGGPQGGPGQGAMSQGFPDQDDTGQQPNGQFHCRHAQHDDDHHQNAPQEWHGTVQSVNATSNNFTLQSEGEQYIVAVNATTKIYDRNHSSLSNITSFQIGDLVGVQGTSSGPTITATEVVNTKLPR